jgi:uncharacterized membrane protein YdjX (TVP38/TMEM64 family)
VDPRVQIKRWALASVPSIIAVAWIGGLDIDAPAWQVLVWLAAVIQLAWAAVKVYRAVRLVISRRRSGTLRR